MKVIRALLLDLGNTLAFFARARVANGLAKFLQRDAHDLHKILHQSPRGEELLFLHETGVLWYEEYRCEVEGLLDADLPPEIFWPIHNGLFEMNRPMIDLVVKAKDHRPDLKLVIVSNCCAPRLEFLEVHIGIQFDAAAASFAVGKLKPNYAMYRKAVVLAGCRPSECLLIDDIDMNVMAARHCGLEAHEYDISDELRDHKVELLFRSYGLVA